MAELLLTLDSRMWDSVLRSSGGNVSRPRTVSSESLHLQSTTFSIHSIWLWPWIRHSQRHHGHTARLHTRSLQKRKSPLWWFPLQMMFSSKICEVSSFTMVLTGTLRFSEMPSSYTSATSNGSRLENRWVSCNWSLTTLSATLCSCSKTTRTPKTS